MDFEYKGANCVVINSKQGTVVVDGKVSAVGLKDVQPNGAIEVATQRGFAGANGRITIDAPGEYEVSNISIKGIAAARMIDHDGSFQSTIYRIAFPDTTVAVLGHIASPLNEEQLESIGVVDVLIVPVGGGGYTLDSHHAVDMVRKIDPKVIIPTHYKEGDKINYEVPQEGLEAFLKELNIAHETMPKWKVKNGAMPEVQTVIELTRTS